MKEEPKDSKKTNKQLDDALENTFPASDPIAMQSSFHATASEPAPYHEKETSPRFMRFLFKVVIIFVVIMALLSFIFKAF